MSVGRGLRKTRENSRAKYESYRFRTVLHDRSHRSGWSDFNRTTVRTESNEYSMQRALNCLFLAHTRQARVAFPLRSFVESKPVLCSTKCHSFNSWPFLHHDEGCCVFLPHEFSALAVLSQEFLHELDVLESSSYSLSCCV